MNQKKQCNQCDEFLPISRFRLEKRVVGTYCLNKCKSCESDNSVRSKIAVKRRNEMKTLNSSISSICVFEKFLQKEPVVNISSEAS